MIFEIVAIVSTMIVIVIIQSIINSIWKKKLGKFGAGALVLLILPSAIMIARGDCSASAVLVIICLVVGIFLLLKDVFSKDK